MKIGEQAHLSKEALFSLASLLSRLPNTEDTARDNVLQKLSADAKEVMVRQLQLLDPESRQEDVAVRLERTTRSELIDLMARILVVVFQAKEGSVHDRACVKLADLKNSN